MKTIPRTILLKGRGYRKEKPAGGTITPGHLIALTTTDTVVVHATAAGKALPYFAVESEHLQGSGAVGGDIDTNYVANDFVQGEILPPGCEVNALVAASASAIVEGDFLESAGDGTLRKATPFSQSGTTPFAVTAAGSIVAQALVALDNSSGGSPARIKVVIV